jgi:hypothetical protein
LFLRPLDVRAELSEQCRAAENSPLAEPDWYAAQCLGRPAPSKPEGAPGSPSFAGDLFYILNIRNVAPNPQSLLTAPLPTLTTTLVGPQIRAIFAMDFDNSATTLWGIDNNTREYGTIDQATGAFTVVGTVTGIQPTPTANVTGMKFDPTSSLVYVSTATELFTLDLGTGAATLVGSFGFPSLVMIDIAISNTGQMYAHDIAADILLSVNKATGQSTGIGFTGLNAGFAQGMDFDSSEDKLYALAYVGGGVNHLAEVNLSTGQFQILVSGANGPEYEGAIKVPAHTDAGVALEIAGGNGNSVLEPNETADLRPTWRNAGASPVSLTGALSNFMGPAGATYSITDGTSSYGTIAPGTQAMCTDCYGIGITSAVRPVQHWDTTIFENKTPTGTGKNWKLHVGESFSDVPTSNPFYRFVETLFHNGVTGGCGGTQYCPGGFATREQMAVFVLVGESGPGFNPPACAPPNIFADVPETSPFCRWIEELSRRGVVSGCGGGDYCPTQPVTREQMPVFVLRNIFPQVNPPDCAPPNIFNDVPETSPFCRWIEELANRGIVTGCGNGNYCPADPVTREQMGVFISLPFGLTLYGP